MRRRLLLLLLVWLQEELVEAVPQIAEGLAEQVIPQEVDLALRATLAWKHLSEQGGGYLLSMLGLRPGRCATKACNPR